MFPKGNFFDLDHIYIVKVSCGKFPLIFLIKSCIKSTFFIQRKTLDMKEMIINESSAFSEKFVCVLPW